jgi:tetratricopeptide (TPR) repeat protein
MISRFADAYTLLDLAQKLGTHLQEGSGNGQGDDNPGLRDQLDSLVRTSYHHRGVVALHANQPDLSLSNHKKFTQMVRDKFGDNLRGKDRSLGVAWNELGNAYLQNKEWAEGIKCFEKSIFALQNLDGATDISVSMPLINLAFGFWLEGRLDEAASTFQRALSDREREYGVDDKTSFV